MFEARVTLTPTDRSEAPLPGTANYNFCMLGAHTPRTYTDARFRAARFKKTVLDRVLTSCR